MSDIDIASYMTDTKPGDEEHALYLLGLQELACFQDGPQNVRVSDEREALLWLQGRN